MVASIDTGIATTTIFIMTFLQPETDAHTDNPIRKLGAGLLLGGAASALLWAGRKQACDSTMSRLPTAPSQAASHPLALPICWLKPRPSYLLSTILG